MAIGQMIGGTAQGVFIQGGGNGGGAIIQPREQTYLEGIDSQLSSIRALAQGNSSRLQGLLDRVYGPDAEKGSGNETPLATGLSNAISAKVHDLLDVLERQRALIERLERLA